MCELPQVYNRYRPVARKAHRCCECGGKIDSGEVYVRHEGLWDGRWETHKTCSDCDRISGVVIERLRCRIDGGLAFGGLYEELSEGDEPKELLEFIQIMRKRGVVLRKSQLEQEAFAQRQLRELKEA